MDALTILYSDSEAFLALRRRRTARRVLPLTILFAIPLALLVLLFRQSDLTASLRLVVLLGWGAWIIALAVALVFPYLNQPTRVLTTCIQPPLRSFLSTLRRGTDSIAVADIEKIERRKGRVRCYLLHTRPYAHGWPEVICEHNVEDFARFSAALKQVFPHLETW